MQIKKQVLIKTLSKICLYQSINCSKWDGIAFGMLQRKLRGTRRKKHFVKNQVLF
jgi:hypothetical protein